MKEKLILFWFSFYSLLVLGRFYMRDKVTDHNLWRERRAEVDSNRGPSAYQPNALPLGQTGSQEGAWLFSDLKVRRILYWTQDSTGCQCRVWRVGDNYVVRPGRTMGRAALFWSLQIRILGSTQREVNYSIQYETERKYRDDFWEHREWIVSDKTEPDMYRIRVTWKRVWSRATPNFWTEADKGMPQPFSMDEEGKVWVFRISFGVQSYAFNELATKGGMVSPDWHIIDINGWHPPSKASVGVLPCTCRSEGKWPSG